MIPRQLDENDDDRVGGEAAVLIPFFPDDHDVDVIGYGGASDDDHSSVRSGTSNASDGGVAITTWRHLNIAEPIH